MHFLHSISPPVRGQSKGNVKLTVDYYRYHSTAHKFHDYHPNVAMMLLSSNVCSRVNCFRSILKCFLTKQLSIFHSDDSYQVPFFQE